MRDKSEYPTPSIVAVPDDDTVGSSLGNVEITIPTGGNLKDMPLSGILRISSPFWVDGVEQTAGFQNYFLFNKRTECTSDQI